VFVLYICCCFYLAEELHGGFRAALRGANACIFSVFVWVACIVALLLLCSVFELCGISWGG